MKRYNRGRLAALVVLLLVASAGWAERTKLKPGWNMFSKQDEVKLGQQANAQVQQKMQMVRDPTLNNYIQQLGMKLARYSPAHDYQYSFQVVRDKSINAFALPGGPVYVNTGTIAACQNEDQLAGVIAHELTHIALRHATNEATKSGLWGLGLGAAGGMVGAGGLANLGASVISMKYSRGAETQADIGGVQMMYDAGYDPDQLARFFQVLESEGGSRSIQFLSDHPNPGNRVGTIQKEERLMGAKQRSPQNPPQFGQAKAIAQRLNNQAASDRAPSGSDQQGVTRGQPGQSSESTQRSGSERPAQPGVKQPPSRQLSTFDGGSFQIGYPSNWKVYGQEAVTIAPPDGLVQGPAAADSGVAYGAMISTFQPASGDARRNVSGATSELIDQLRQANPELRVTSGNQAVDVRGRRGTSVTLSNRSPLGEREVDWLVAIPQPDGTLWYVIFISPESEYTNLRSSFQQMMDSLQFR